jgi:hypothetical protein
VNLNASHSCVQLTLDEFFGDRREQRQLYEALLGVVRRFGLRRATTSTNSG